MDSRYSNQDGSADLDTAVDAIAGPCDNPESIARSKANALRILEQLPVSRAVGSKERASRRRLMQLGALAASVACILCLISLLLGKDNLYAQMRQTLARCQTIQVARYDFAKDGSIEKRNHLLVKDDCFFRAESPDGLLVVLNFEDMFSMRLNTKTKTGEVVPLYGTHFPGEHLQIILRLLKGQLPRDARRIGTKTIEGVALVEYEIEAWNELPAMRVVIDPATSLPVRVDSVEAEFRLDDFRFDDPLPDELFTATAPADYSVTRIERQPPTDDSSLILDPEIGIGTARFGMALAEVRERIGKPDGMRLLPGNETRTKQLVYASRGFNLYFDGKGRFCAVICSAGADEPKDSRVFGGSLCGEFRFGDGRDKFHALLGKPDQTSYPVSADPAEREAEKLNPPDYGGDKYVRPRYRIDANFDAEKITTILVTHRFEN